MRSTLLKESVEVVVVVPDGLSKGVVNSQVLNLKELFDDYVKVNFFSLHNGYLTNFYIPENRYKAKDYLARGGVKLIYTRSHFDFMKVFFLKNRPPIYHDFRGAVFAESYLRNKSMIRASVLFIIDFFVFHAADYRGTVSNNFSAWLKRSFLSKKAVNVIPCCIKSVKLGYSPPLDGSNFVYVGGSSKYQNLGDVVIILNKLVIERPLSLTIISNDMVKIREQLEHLCNFDVHYMSLSQKDVLTHLPNYDFGFILRSDLLLNRVASPIKLLEYASCGVVPIMTSFIGDYSNALHEKEINVIVNDNELTWEMLDKRVNDNKIREKLKLFSSDYTWDMYRAKMMSIFRLASHKR